jgi:hypothetical protein
MRAQRVVRHQLIGDLFGERGLQTTSDVDGRQLPVLTHVVRS